MARTGTGQNLPAEAIAYTSLPFDPFTPLIGTDGNIAGIEGSTALPTGHDVSIQQTERTYALMLHFSRSLDQNCTFCHNTRSFSSYAEANPTKVTAWHGIRMLRAVNSEHIAPLEPVLPANRRGPEGDPLKASCATCHQGANKPLMGAQMAKDYPWLNGQ